MTVALGLVHVRVHVHIHIHALVLLLVRALTLDPVFALAQDLAHDLLLDKQDDTVDLYHRQDAKEIILQVPVVMRNVLPS